MSVRIQITVSDVPPSVDGQAVANALGQMLQRLLGESVQLTVDDYDAQDDRMDIFRTFQQAARLPNVTPSFGEREGQMTLIRDKGGVR